MVRDEDQSLALDSPRLKLRQEIHAEHVEAAEARRGDDLQVARDDIAGAKLTMLPVSAGATPLAVRSMTGVSPVPVSIRGGARGGFGDRGDRRAAVDQHPRLTPLIEATTQKWPSGAIRTRNSLPTTCWSSSPSARVRRVSSGW